MKTKIIPINVIEKEKYDLVMTKSGNFSAWDNLKSKFKQGIEYEIDYIISGDYKNIKEIISTRVIGDAPVEKIEDTVGDTKERYEQAVKIVTEALGFDKEIFKQQPDLIRSVNTVFMSLDRCQQR